jgi:hypothetical protein
MMSSPARRIHWPAFGATRMRTRAPLQGLGVFLHHHRVGARGMGAPVKMRAALPGASGRPTLPAGMRWLTGSSAPGAAQSALRTA